MKKFLQLFIICLVLEQVFMFFGGWRLFQNWFSASVFIALVLAISIRIWLSQEDRLEAMEKRIKELEEQQVQKEKQE